MIVRVVPAHHEKPVSRHDFRLWPWLTLGAFLLLMGGSQLLVRSRAEDLHQSILAGTSSVAMAESWRQYHEVEKLDLFNHAEDKLRQSANRILDLYTLEDVQDMGWEQWETALRLSGAALEIDPGDPLNKARLAYCKGHLRQESANKFPLSKSFGEAEKASVREAIKLYQEAAALDPDWPDPHVSLASIQALLNLDLPEMERSITEAERLGYRNLRRFTEYRAEGHARYGWSLARKARFDSESGWQKRQLFEEGIQNLEQAIDLYRQLPRGKRILDNREGAEKWLSYAQSWQSSARKNGPTAPSQGPG